MIAEFKVTSIDFFWTAEPFVTRLGMVINHHKPEFNLKILDCYLQGQTQSQTQESWLGLLESCWESKYDYFCCIFCMFFWSFCSWICLMVHHHKLKCFCEKIALLRSRSRSQCWMFVQMGSSEHFVAKFRMLIHHDEYIWGIHRFAIVKVTRGIMTNVLKMWLLLSLQSCWLFQN